MKSGRAPASLCDVNSVRMVQVGLGPDPYALDALQKDAGVPADRCFESLKEAIAATEPEAMLNTTALSAHVAVIRAGFEAGLHVLVEKPFAPSLAIARQLVDAAAARNLVLMVSQNYRFFPPPPPIAELVREQPPAHLHQVPTDFRRFSPPGPNGRGRHHL